MRPNPLRALARPWPSRLAPILLGLAPGGCARERGEITPTTLGTDFTRSPKGRMIPFPWPGQSISRAEPAPVDPQAALASGDPAAAH